MSWLRRSSAQKPDYTALEIQTSTSTLPIPIVWGRNKLAANVLWYANFRAVAGNSGKGGGKGHVVQAVSSVFGGGSSSSATTYTYYADLIMGILRRADQ